MGKPIYGKKMVQTAIWMPSSMLEKLKKGGNVSKKIRYLVETESKQNLLCADLLNRVREAVKEIDEKLHQTALNSNNFEISEDERRANRAKFWGYADSIHIIKQSFPEAFEEDK